MDAVDNFCIVMLKHSVEGISFSDTFSDETSGLYEDSKSYIMFIDIKEVLTTSGVNYAGKSQEKRDAI